MKQDSGYYVIIYRGGRNPEIIRFAIVKKTNTGGNFLYNSTRKRVFKKLTTRVLNKYYSCTSNYIKPWKLRSNQLIPDSCRESLKSVVDQLVSEYINYGTGFEKIKILCSYETK